VAWILNYMSLGEFTKLVFCLSIDIVEYIMPMLLEPLVGDIFDIFALVSCIYMFKWIGLISALDLIPGLDVLPVNSITWIIWFTLKRQKEEIGRVAEE